MSAAESPSALLRVRLAVSVAQILCGVGGIFGSGVRGSGSSVRDFAQGAFRPEATLIAPASLAFSIWSVIYLGLVVYTLWIWVPGAASATVVARTGWWAAAAMALNGGWIFAAKAELVDLGALVLLALTLCLGRVNAELAVISMPTRTARTLVGGAFGLFLGWACLATVGNVATALVRHGVPATGAGATIAAVGTLVVVAALGVFLAVRLPGQFAVALGLLWGLAWLAVQRSAGEPKSLPVALTAGFAAAVIAGAFVTTRPLRPTADAPLESVAQAAAKG